MSSATSSERAQAFSSDARDGTGGTKIDSANLLRFHFTQTSETSLSHQFIDDKMTLFDSRRHKIKANSSHVEIF